MSQRGAASLAAILLLVLFMAAAGTAALWLQTSHLAEQATTAADAAAHDALAAILDLADADTLSIEALSGATPCLVDDQHAASAASGDCAPVVAAATAAAGREHAHLSLLAVGPNPSDRLQTPVPGRLDVLAEVTVDGPLAGFPPICSGPFAEGKVPAVCHIVAAAGAEDIR